MLKETEYFRNISSDNVVIMKVLIIIVYNCYNYSQRQFSSSGHSQVVPEGFRAAQSAWQPQRSACSHGCCLVIHKWGQAVCSLALQHHPCPHALGCSKAQGQLQFFLRQPVPVTVRPISLLCHGKAVTSTKQNEKNLSPFLSHISLSLEGSYV